MTNPPPTHVSGWFADHHAVNPVVDGIGMNKTYDKIYDITKDITPGFLVLILHTFFTAAMLPTQPIPLPIQRQIAAQQAAGLQQVHTQQIQVQQQQQQQQQQQLIDQQALQQQVLWCFIFKFGRQNW